MPTASEPVVYHVDRDDRLIQVSESWTVFAGANDAPELAGPKVLGRPLWDFIADIGTVHLYRGLLERVRAGRPAQFPFRCDGPAVRRPMEMTMVEAGDGGVEFRCQFLGDRPRDPQPVLDRRADRSHDLLVLCGWCKKALAGGEWVEVEVAVGRLAPFDRAAPPRLSHGICPPCLAAATALVDGR